MSTAIDTWIARARRGDVAAFNRLVDHFQAPAYHVAYHHLGDVDDALECCQEAMLSAWHAVGRFEGDASAFQAWLMRIVVNTGIDRLRRRARRPTVPLHLSPEGDAWVPRAGWGGTDAVADAADPPEVVLEQAELAGMLAAALATLTEAHRSVVLLDHVGFNYAEIAAALDIEVGTVKSRLSRARAHLRAALAGVGASDRREPDHAARR